VKFSPQQKCLYFRFAQGIGAVAPEHMDAIGKLLAAGTIVEGFQAVGIQVLCPGMTQTAGGRDRTQAALLATSLGLTGHMSNRLNEF
jgi:hypothetical protein